jgi:hypothetical protein
MLHVVPSHSSANVAQVPEKSMRRPTATHDRGDVHDTPKAKPSGTAGSGARCSAQAAVLSGMALAGADELPGTELPEADGGDTPKTTTQTNPARPHEITFQPPWCVGFTR